MTLGDARHSYLVPSVHVCLARCVHRVLESGMVITVEPGCYFNNALLGPALKVRALQNKRKEKGRYFRCPTSFRRSKKEGVYRLLLLPRAGH